ncbi:MAG: HAMP domain-containing protein, partial [Desulfobacterales bacterium]
MENDRRRRKREYVAIIVVAIAFALLTYVEQRSINFGGDIPVSSTILMFILTNINLLLLLLLTFLVFRNLVKLLYERKRKVMGSKLRTRLVAAFITLTLLPATVLFIFAIGFITTSIEFWFNVPVEQALENSLKVGQQFYGHLEVNNKFFLDRVAYQVRTKDYLSSGNQTSLENYLKVVQRAFHLDGLEIYDGNANRLKMALDDTLQPDIAPVPRENFQRQLVNGEVRSLTMPHRIGELYRTIGAVPPENGKEDPPAFIVVTTILPAELLANMDSITTGFEEYQQIKLVKAPIKTTYYMTLTVVALLVVFCAIWFGFQLAKSISIPIQSLAEGTVRVAEGDLGFEIAVAGDDEIGRLVDSFNRMTRDLRMGREQLELSSQKLREQNIEIEARRQYMEIVLQNVSAGVITIDAGGFVTTINTSAADMLHLNAEAVMGQNFQRLLQGRYLTMAQEVLEELEGSSGNAVRMTLKATIAGTPRSFLMHINALKDENDRQIGMVVVFDDLTELEKAQRMAAWREVARRIAHEVKNPLTPITLSAQRLKRKYSAQLEEPVFDECTQMIIDQVELIRNLVNEFSTFARFPSADPTPNELPEIVREAVALYREAHPQVTFDIE